MNICSDTIPGYAPACSKVTAFNIIKNIKVRETDFKERYNMPFSKFIKLIKGNTDIEINTEVICDGKIVYYECKIKSGMYSVTFRMK